MNFIECKFYGKWPRYAVTLHICVEPTILQAVFKPLHEIWHDRLLSQIAVIRLIIEIRQAV